MTFSEFERRVAGFRGWLRSSGVRPGDRVALMLKNSLAYPVAWLGTATSGAVAVPVNSRLREMDARYVLEHSGAVALVTDDATEAVARAASPDSVRSVFVARTHDPMAELEAADPAAPRWFYTKKTFDPDNMNKVDEQTIVVLRKDPKSGKMKGAEVLFL